MKRLLRRLSPPRVADSLQYRPAKDGGGGGKRLGVPEGHVPVYVGDEEETERFAVPTEFLGRPAFTELLRRAAQEYGYKQRGVLRIPCPVPLFCRILRSLSVGDGDDDADRALRELSLSISDGIHARARSLP